MGGTCCHGVGTLVSTKRKASPRQAAIAEMAVVVKTVLGHHFGGFRCTTHFRTYFSGDWDVHWGYDLDFDPFAELSHSRSSWTLVTFWLWTMLVTQ